MTGCARSAGYKAARKLSRLPAMILGFDISNGHKPGPSNVLIRSKSLTAIIAVGLCSIVYLTWLLPAFSVRIKLGPLLPTLSVNTEAHTHWNNDPRRLIVFGDSWSDDGQYPVDPPPRDQIPRREEAQGKISCTHHDNFARKDAVVDSNLLNKTMLDATNFNITLIADFELEEPLADLQTQIQQWLKFEKQQYGSRRVSEAERNGTIFTMWFSLWDLWYYSEKSMSDAQYAVTKAIDILFEQLDVIAENWPSEMKIIMPEAIDATFLPRWRGLRTGPRGSDPHGENQRNAVLLVEQWNQALDMRATRWQGGSMYIYNTNEWLLDQVREHQMFEAHLRDAKSPWNNVRSGCIESSKATGDVAGAVRCSDPTTYLFWDDAHLGNEAMRMIGEGIAQDIASNRGSLGWFAHEVYMTYDGEDQTLPMDATTKGLSSPTPSASPTTASPPEQPPPLESQPTQ